MTAQLHPRELIEQLWQTFTIVQLPKDSPDIRRLFAAYCAQFNLPNRQPDQERAFVWRGVEHNGAIIAVFGERLENNTLEITDAYHDDTLEGIAAYAMLAFGYLKMARTGEVDSLVHTSLFANKKQWQSIMQQTGDEPFALVFRHTKKENA